MRGKKSLLIFFPKTMMVIMFHEMTRSCPLTHHHAKPIHDGDDIHNSDKPQQGFVFKKSFHKFM